MNDAIKVKDLAKSIEELDPEAYIIFKMDIYASTEITKIEEDVDILGTKIVTIQL